MQETRRHPKASFHAIVQFDSVVLAECRRIGPGVYSDIEDFSTNNRYQLPHSRLRMQTAKHAVFGKRMIVLKYFINKSNDFFLCVSKRTLLQTLDFCRLFPRLHSRKSRTYKGEEIEDNNANRQSFVYNDTQGLKARGFN